MIAALERHPNASTLLGPVLEGRGEPSHAYLFHGPGGAGKAQVARQFAAALLADGSPDPASAQARALAGAHPDLSWVSPSGAHEMLVSDIDGPVVAAASRTPFESRRRLFVIEGADQLGDDAANRMLKTLEEPPSYVHIILLAENLQNVLPTIRSRCQLVRFEPCGEAELTAELQHAGLTPDTASACARLGFGDARAARALADDEGVALRQRAVTLVRSALAGRASSSAPWSGLLAAVSARGEQVQAELEEARAADLELYPKRERARVEREWDERIKRNRRRAQTEALTQALTLAESWLLDLAALAFGAQETIRNADLRAELDADAAVGRGAEPQALLRAVELIEDTRTRLTLNVSDELACEALSYRIEELLAR